MWQKCSLGVVVHVLAGAAVGYVLATLLEGPRVTFVQLNASTSFSCLFLVGSPNASARDVIVQWISGGRYLAFQSFVDPTYPAAALLIKNTSLLPLNGTHSLLNYSLLVQSARPEHNACFSCRSGNSLSNAFLNVEGTHRSLSVELVAFILYSYAVNAPLYTWRHPLGTQTAFTRQPADTFEWPETR